MQRPETEHKNNKRTERYEQQLAQSKNDWISIKIKRKAPKTCRDEIQLGMILSSKDHRLKSIQTPRLHDLGKNVKTNNRKSKSRHHGLKSRRAR
jgi:hypothetical protein